jgi:Uma2 family endonuclease
VTVPLTPITAPEPDIVLTTAPGGEGYTPLSSVALVVEIAHTTLRYDLNEKKDLYARAGIAECWIVDIQARQVHQFWAPTGTEYSRTRIVPLAGELRSATVLDLAIDGTGIL